MHGSKTIGFFESRIHFSRIIEDVRLGNTYTITKRGKPVAKLVPYENHGVDLSVEDIIARFDTIRKAVKVKVSIKDFIDEDRKR